MMFSTRRSRRHRNPQQSGQEEHKPFFSKTNDTGIQTKEENAFFQPKPATTAGGLNIGRPGDKYEQEADAMADTVVSNSGNATIQQKKADQIQRVALASPEKDEKLGTAEQRMEEDKMIQEKPEEAQMQEEEEEAVQMQAEEEEEPVQMQAEEEEEPVQMQAEEEEEPVQMQAEEEEEAVQLQEEEEESVQMQEEEKEKEVQAKSDPAQSSKASNQLSSKINQQKGRGKALPDNTRSEMENSFGVDFSEVNIHTDNEAAEMNKELGAQAFTTGKDVYFNNGKYRPETSDGKHLLAHELTHVVQQKGGKKVPGIQRKGGSKTSLTATRFKNNAKLEQALQGNIYIKKGAKGAHVTILQKALIDDGIPLSKFGVDGIFGNETKKAVRAYQAKHTLGKDGIVGPETMGHLDKNFAATVKTDRYTKWYKEQIKLYKNESAFPFHIAIMNVFYSSRNFHVIQILNDVKYEIWTFTGATDFWKYNDGRIEKKDLSNRLRGNTDRRKKIIRLNPKLSALKAATTLYHELNHVTSKEPDYLKQEVESRVLTEQFAIDNNLPPTKKEYRTKDGKVNVAYIQNEIKNSSHYNPTNKKRIKRTYTGMKKIGPWNVPN